MRGQNRDVFLITGACGFLASRLIPAVMRECGGARIILADKAKRKMRRGEKAAGEFICGDLRQSSVWRKFPKSITHVFHLAADIPWGDRDKDSPATAVNNLMPLAHLIRLNRDWLGLKQVIYSSSISVYGQSGRFLNEESALRPEGIYGAAKLSGERLLMALQSRGVRVACLRYSSICGYGQYQGTVLPIMVDRAINKKDIIVFGDGKRSQDFLECDDAASANILAYKKHVHGVFNIGSGEPVTMNVLARMVNRIFSDGRARIINRREKGTPSPGYKIDISKAQKILGYEPRFQINEGLLKLKNDILQNKGK